MVLIRGIRRPVCAVVARIVKLLTRTVARSRQEHTAFGSKGCPLSRGTLGPGLPRAYVVDCTNGGNLRQCDVDAVWEQDHAVHAISAVVSINGGVGVASLRGAKHGAASGTGIEYIRPLGLAQRAPRVAVVDGVAPVTLQGFRVFVAIAVGLPGLIRRVDTILGNTRPRASVP